MEFFLNVFTEFAEFSDKNSCHYSKRARTLANQPPLVWETSMLPQCRCTVMKLPFTKMRGGKFITVKNSHTGLFGTCLHVWKTYPHHEISTSTPWPLVSILERHHPPHSLLKSYSPLEKRPTITARAHTLTLCYSVNMKGIPTQQPCHSHSPSTNLFISFSQCITPKWEILELSSNSSHTTQNFSLWR